MRWHEYRPTFCGIAKAIGAGGTARQRANAAIKRLQYSDAPKIQKENTIAQLDNEAAWIENDRPYYDLYPSVAEAFLKIDLQKLDCKHLRLPLPELLIRMPVGQELALSPRTKLRTLMLAEAPISPLAKIKAVRGWIISIDNGESFELLGVDCPMHTVAGVVLPDDGGTIEDSLRRGREGPVHGENVDDEAIAAACRIAATLCLLGGNPDLIEPEPLESDRERWESTHDPALIDKAGRRGKRCWSVGKHIEIAPGFRTPHFAIRWMKPRGAGIVPTDKPVNREHSRAHLLPVVRPIKGCLVRRQQIQEVPTDYLGPEIETAVQHAQD